MRRDPDEPGPPPEPPHAAPGAGPPDDAELVRWAQRDLAAFGPVYELHFGPVFGYCYRRLGDREAAADATSLTFTRAMAGIHGFRAGSVGAWLMTIARNVVIDAVRARRPESPIDDGAALSGRDPLPELQTIARDEQAALRHAIAQLTAEQQDIVHLRWAGLSGPEIAEALGISHRAVRSGQYRAYARLRALLDRDDFFGERP